MAGVRDGGVSLGVHVAQQAPEPGVAPGLEGVIASEVVRHALAVAVEEASIVVVRSSHSTFIQEGADACAAVLDTTGALVAQSMATSLVHGSSLRACLPSLLEDVALEDMAPGDVFVMNDPFRGGIHANDLVVLRPVFDGTAVAYFAGTLIHVADLGGVAAGGLAALATDTFAEGLLLPPIRLYRQGELVEDVARVLRRNSRAPDQVMGDISALVAGVNVASLRLGELLAQYGGERLARLVADQLDHAEQAMRAELALLPPGTYHGRFTIDSDGLEAGRTFDVRVAATIADGTITIDLSGTDAQSRGAINSSWSQTMSGVMFAVRCFVDPDIPMNDGCFRPVVVHLPRGTVVNPDPPAACGGRVVTVFAVIEALLQALAHARPDRAVASSGTVHVFTMTAVPEAQRRWLAMLYDFGGIGARRGSDGPDATGAFFLGGRSTIPQVEPLEAQYPIVVRRVAVREDSGGPGCWRGGLGSETAIEVQEEAVVTVRGDRMALPPPGLEGGWSGGGGVHAVERADGRFERLAPKQSDVHLAPGDVLVLATSGGGGLGSPLDRDPEAVRADVATGSVSWRAAADIYGVVLHDGTVDQEATRAQRDELAASGDRRVTR